MAGMLDKLFEDKANKIKEDFDKRLSQMERGFKDRFDRLEKKMDDISSKLK